jgi:hypothetical protein
MGCSCRMWTPTPFNPERPPARGRDGGVRQELAARVRTSIGVAAMIPSPLFTSMPTPNGGTWTLTTYFGRMLSVFGAIRGGIASALHTRKHCRCIKPPMDH